MGKLTKTSASEESVKRIFETVNIANISLPDDQERERIPPPSFISPNVLNSKVLTSTSVNDPS